MKLPDGTHVVPVATLSKQGYLFSTGARLDRRLAHYFLSNKNQTLIFGQHVKSFQHTLAEHEGSPYVLCDAIKNELTRYLETTFRIVTVEVNYVNDKEVEAGTYTLHIDVIAGDTEEDQQRMLKHVAIEDSALAAVFTYSNTGELVKHDYSKNQSRYH